MNFMIHYFALSLCYSSIHLLISTKLCYLIVFSIIIGGRKDLEIQSSIHIQEEEFPKTIYLFIILLSPIIIAYKYLSQKDLYNIAFS